jgi:Bardet-Biedl syndrome 2 protein
MKVDEYNAVRLKLTAEMADSSQLVKALVIKAEDARILNDMKLMKKMYSSLYDVNRELIGEYIKRANNHNELLSALKEVNAMIQKAARLRIGAAKTKVITECRNSIKSNNIHSLFKIIRLGHLN